MASGKSRNREATASLSRYDKQNNTAMTTQSRSDQLNRASNRVLEETSFLYGANAQFIEQLYAQWLENPEAVEPSWRAWFTQLGQRGLSPTQLGRGPGWRRDARLPRETDELTGALTGLWPPRKSEAGAADGRAAAKDSVRAF